MTLLVFGMEREHISDGYRFFAFDRFILTLKRLTHTARLCGTEVIFMLTDHFHELENSIIDPQQAFYPGLCPTTDEKIFFIRHPHSPFKDSGLLEYLRKKEETELMLAGLAANGVINLTYILAREHGFRVYVPEYGNTAIANAYMSAETTYRYYNEFVWNSIPLGDALELIAKPSKNS